MFKHLSFNIKKAIIIPFISLASLKWKRSSLCQSLTEREGNLYSGHDDLNSLDVNRNHDNLSTKPIGEILDIRTYLELKNIKTTHGNTIDSLIEKCMDPNTTLDKCLIAPDSEVYSKFYDLYLKYYQKAYKDEDFSKPFENESYSMIKSLSLGMEEILSEFFREIEIETKRNLNEFPFAKTIDTSNRKRICNTVKDAISSLEEGIFDNKGVFINMADTESKSVVNPSGDLYNDWPNGRKVYKNNSIVCHVNKIDHLTFRMKIQGDDDTSKHITEYFELLEKLEGKLNFAMNKTFGFLNTFPNDCGTGTKFQVRLKITQNQNKHKEILSKLDENSKDINFNIFQSNNGEYQIQISNKTPFYTFSTLLVDILGIKDYLK